MGTALCTALKAILLGAPAFEMVVISYGAIEGKVAQGGRSKSDKKNDSPIVSGSPQRSFFIGGSGTG